MKIKALYLLVLIIFAGCEQNRLESGSTIITERTLLEDYLITSIAFAPDGTAWAGTFNQGIIRVDGKQTTIYDSSNSNLPDSVWIKVIRADQYGNVWFGGDGLFRYNGEEFEQFFSSEKTYPAEVIDGIEITSDGTVWIASSTHDRGGISTLASEAWTTFSDDNSDLPSHYINAITIDRQDDLWVAFSSSGDSPYLAKYSNGQWQSFDAEDLGFQPYWIREIRTDHQDQLWGIIDYSLSSAIYDDRPVLFSFNGSEAETYVLPESDRRPGLVHAISIDAHDRIWVGTSREVHIFTDGQWSESYEIPGQTSLYAIEQRDEGETWLGTTHGILVVNTEP